MNADSELRTAEVKMFKEDPAAFGGEETHSRPWWADSEDNDAHPYWVIDYLEAGGWLQHLPEAEVGDPVSGITVHYNPEERNDIQKVVLPDGSEIEADER